MKSLADRIRKAMQARGATLTELAAACGVKPPSVHGWMSGKTKNLIGSNAMKAAQFLGVNQLWLTDGKGPMMAANTEPGPDHYGMVPLVSWVQAGQWAEVADPYRPGEAEDWMFYPRKNSDLVFALRVRGDSMTSQFGRSFPDGCVIFVDPEQRSPVNGDCIVAKMAGQEDVTFKVFVQDAGRSWLKPLNPQHPAIMDPFHVIGKVVGKWEDV